MSVQSEINSRTAKLQAILADANTAITAKSGTAAANLSGIPAAIEALVSGEVKLQSKTVTPTGQTFTVRPGSGGMGGHGGGGGGGGGGKRDQNEGFFAGLGGTGGTGGAGGNGAAGIILVYY